MRRITKRAKVLMAGIAVLVVLTVVAMLLWKSVFVVRNVIVEGAVNASDEVIIRASEIDMGGSIWKVDEAALRKALESSGRYALDGIQVELPNTVALFVRERTRDAVVRNGGQYLVLDSDGYVVEVLSSMPAESGIFVNGLEGTSYLLGGRISAPEEKLAAMKCVLEAIRIQAAGAYVSEVNLEDVMSIWITSRTGIRVELGDSLNMEAKVLWMRSVVADLEGQGATGGTLDVSSGTKADYRS